MPLVIGVTDCSKYENYAGWIQRNNPSLEIIRLTEKIWNIEDVKRCNGIVYTGGEDVHPKFYNKPEYLPYCHSADVNEKRDEFELKLMEYTESNGVPAIGICRGLQIYNVFMGGTLIPDIPSWKLPPHSKTNEGKDRYHQVKIKHGSWLESVIGQDSGEINSNHHQAADIPGKGLVICGVSEDGVVEALERENNDGKGFLCLVQWHPERMYDQESLFVKKLKSAFLEAAMKYNI
ncbi:MAG: gamma-glutamyl-gamma-aminobutyrate hydrolase family protein [Cytophagaceae bacterium]